MTDANGVRNLPLPIPNDVNLVGPYTYWQSLVLDATAPAGLGFTVSDGLEIRLGTYSYSVN